MENKEMIKVTVNALNEKKAVDIRVIKIEKLSVVADYFVISNGTSSTHVKTLADEVEETLSKQGIEPLHREGYRHGGWILLDYGSVIAHIFDKDARDFYQLERLWADGEKIDITEFLEKDIEKK